MMKNVRLTAAAENLAVLAPNKGSTASEPQFSRFQAPDSGNFSAPVGREESEEETIHSADVIVKLKLFPSSEYRLTSWVLRQLGMLYTTLVSFWSGDDWIPGGLSEPLFNAKATSGAPSVMKAQILAGGRGKGKPDEAFENASNMIGYSLVTKQTPPDGLPVNKLYIYKSVDIAQEFYVAITFDRARYKPVLLMSDDGGVNIESNVNQLQRFWFNLSTGITPEIAAYIEAQFGFSDDDMGMVTHILRQLVKLFREKDATLLELNPFVRTTEGSLICIDAKFNFDDSAKFRQPELVSLVEHSAEEKDEYEASQLGLSYIRLDGNIGVIVNGAGLAMATNDLVTLYGGNCANFLDIGGGATKETLSKAFSILQGDSRTKALFINIYGGEY
ncbi:unnamed protein product [Aspergillus oryzae var. brunneus]|uniref:Unnamed protein product n=1 Tax=Aspergillus oryzae var. brunneus TaxID=332754 RepID=A0ABQ6KBD0_ASPOZ|nr:unnamed protein product [Aspergillus oryzae var. brunneus]